MAVVFSLLLMAMIFTRRPLNARFKGMNARVGRLSEDNIGLTLWSLAIAVVRVMPLPLTLAVVAWAIEHGAPESPFSVAVARGMFAVAPFLYNVMFVPPHMCRRWHRTGTFRLGGGEPDNHPPAA